MIQRIKAVYGFIEECPVLTVANIAAQLMGMQYGNSLLSLVSWYQLSKCGVIWTEIQKVCNLRQSHIASHTFKPLFF